MVRLIRTCGQVDVTEQVAFTADVVSRTGAAAALGERADEFLALKVEGVLECAELLVVALGDGRDKHVFGRRTLPQMDLASVSCAIQNLWLAARS